ncbi:LysE family translocator [Magnetovibrio sp. PR-2]|uniref:LysE family translocator n=1 Tax=Magnetovibrio sp. PR-2 TaxID=3120356 RepID=UPI002FCDF4BD
MSPESALAFFLAVFVFSITPGAGVFAILARALTQGAGSCWGLAIGMAISDILYLIAACFGLAAIATHFNEVFIAVRILGAAYLIYLGWKMWTAPVDLSMEDGHSRRTGFWLTFMQGFLISGSNPKVILFYIAFLPTFMDISALGTFDIALASVLTLIALTMGLMLIAFFAAKARGYFKSEKAMKRLNRGAGSVMMGAGAFLAGHN